MSVVISFIMHIPVKQLLQAAGGLTLGLILQSTLREIHSCEPGICIWGEISQMRKTCLPLVSVSVQGLAYPGGTNELLLLPYWLTVHRAPQFPDVGGDCILKKFQVLEVWLPAAEREGVLVLCCLTPLLRKYHTDVSQRSCLFWQLLPSYMLILQVNLSYLCQPFPLPP